MKKHIAVVLSGSGYLDGSEIREAVATLWALSQQNVEVQCFAPDAAQADVVNTLTGKQVSGETRNMMVEAARIARGKIKPLDQLSAKDFAAVILPGGYGAAKNLCTFATQGSQGTVRKDVQTVIETFYNAKKPIGAICIAPAIVALALKNKNIELTVGAPCEASQEIEKLGHKHIATQATEAHIDSKNRIITTAAYMFDDAPLHEIFTGVQKLVNETVRLS
jgi:enhancing lycopene biosynthesis protein 2